MRVNELFESIDFVPMKKREDGVYDSPMHDVEEECWTCDGSGINPYRDGKHKCDHCDGTKVLKHKEWTMPHMNVSNDNAYLILKALDLPKESAGIIHNKDLPTLKRKLVKLLNTDVQQHTRAASDTQHRHTAVTHVDGIPTIQRMGPRIIDPGVSSHQLKSYVERLIKIVDAAQKHNYDISWA